MTRSRKKRPKLIPGAITATPERMRLAGYAFDDMVEATAGGMLKKTGAIRVWSALEDLFRNKRITAPQYDAGEKYYRDWYLGFQASSQVTMKWSDYVSGLGGGDNQSMDAAERKVFHAKRFTSATAALPHKVRKPIHWLVINGIHPQDIGRRFRGYRGQRTAQTCGVTTIDIGLDELARFYGLIK